MLQTIISILMLAKQFDEKAYDFEKTCENGMHQDLLTLVLVLPY